MKPEVFSWWRRACLLGALGVFLAGASSAAPTPTPRPSPPPQASAASPPPAPTPTPPPALALAEITPQAQTDLAKLKSFEPEDTTDQTAETVQRSLPEVETAIDALRDRTSRAAANVGSSLDTLHNLQREWTKIETTLTGHSDALGKRGQALYNATRQVEESNAVWVATKDAAKAPDFNAPPETLDHVSEVIYSALEAQTRIKVRRNRILELQNHVHTLLTRIDSGQEMVSQSLASTLKTLLVRESAPLWAPEAQPAPGLPGRWRAAQAEETAQFHEFIDAHTLLFAVHAAVFLALLALLLFLRRTVHRWTEDEPHLKRAAPVFDVPGATALVLSFLVMGSRYRGAPNLIHASVSALALLPTIVLLRRLLAPRLYLVLWSLVAFTVLDQIRITTTALPTINRWIFCGEMAGAVGVFLFLIRLQRGRDPNARSSLGKWIPAVFGLAVAVFAAALGANALGFARLGTLIGTAALQSAYTAVFLYALLRVLDGLTVITLRVRPVSASRIAQTHRDQVQAQVYGLFRLGAIFLWLKSTLAQVPWLTSLYERTVFELGKEYTLGSVSISLEKVLGFAVAIWLSLLISRVLRFFLSEEVYERVQLAPGLPYAISTMLNYLVLFIGSLVALGVLGVPLEKFSLVAGAFSVGLGFGLQNIINNFVSGIILLFERPVKVGDVIQFGDSTGEVRRIGIRASIIRTREGADIILPNGNLISNQVTNWTYADRRRAVEVALTIAAGPDPNHLIQLLKTAATKEPATEDQPVPEVYITGITAGGLNLIVRAWTHRYEDWIEMRSELIATLLTTLARENIKLI